MATPRKRQICLEQTPYYHCISRCVRRAFLCGIDRLTGRSFEHRRDWVEARLHQLAGAFAIDIAAYAIMSNHHHVVLRVAPEEGGSWSGTEVCERWGRLFRLPDDVQRYLAGELRTPREREAVEARIAVYRERLMSISWFMKCLNTDIARSANREDNCTGRFFEGRFKCQALLDQAALLQCMAYVDLNPVRAGIARTAETATHTALAHRIKTKRHGLIPFAAQSAPPGALSKPGSNLKAASIPITFDGYRALVRWTVEILCSKPVATLPSGLAWMRIDAIEWQKSMRPGALERARALGAPSRLRAFAAAVGQAWVWGHATTVA